MKFTQNKNIQNESGAVMMTSVIFFVVIATIVVLGLTGPSVREYRIANDSILSKQSYFLAESGAEDAYYRLKNHYSTSPSQTLVLGSFTAVTAMNSLSGGVVDIVSIGNVNNRQRGVEIKASGQSNPVFNFGALSSSGGLDLSESNAVVDGNAYLSGPITGAYGSIITGSAVSASSPGLSINQSNGSGTPPYDISFGNANASKDIMQSFQLNQNSPLNKIALYIKRVGTPTDATVTIYRNKSVSNTPDFIPITSATLSAGSVDTNYSWVDVEFSQKQLLTVGETYWFVVTQNISASDYYVIGATNGGYASGIGKIGQFQGVMTDPVSSTSNYYFQIYLGGVLGKILGEIGGISIGTTPSDYVQANSVGNVNATGQIYCTNNLGGTKDISGNSKSCVPQTDPNISSFPISDTDISGWESDASSGASSSGDWVVGSFGASTTGPKKISGNVTVNRGLLTIGGTLWITGDLNFNSNGKINLSSGYGSNSGVVIVDGKINFSGGFANGSGADGSYILLISKSNSMDPASPAINAHNHGPDSAIFYAPYGLVTLSGSTALSQVSAYQMSLSAGSTISYNPNLSSITFLSGSTIAVPYSISSWVESQ
ncbi:MAG: hypothetical protein WCO65_00050 [bacterium]